MSDLADRKCKPCEGGIDPLDGDRVDVLLGQVAGWQLTDNGSSIRRDFQFTDFLKTMSFINAVAWVANRQGHHPDLNAGYNYCHVTFTTHAIRGLSENDFICAYQLNELTEN